MTENVIAPTLSRRRLLQLGALAPLLAGCAGTEPPRIFSLRPLPPAPHAGSGFTLGIDPPKALKGLDTERIAYRARPYELEYYTGADWIDLAPEMVQMVLVRSFQNRTPLVVSDRSAGSTPPDFVLTTLLQDFQADAGKGAQVTLVATLSLVTHRRQARTRTFEAGLNAADDRIESIVAAFDQALGVVTTDLIAWTLATAEEEKREG